MSSPTILSYLHEFSSLSGLSVLLSCAVGLSDNKECSEPSEVAVVLDKTLFYPGGGGQPCDIGILEGPDWKIKVTSVRFNTHRQVVHQGKIDYSSNDSLSSKGNNMPAVGCSVRQHVDAQTRGLHSRLHTAGHILDIALLDVLHHNDKMSVYKANHHPVGSAVEYSGTLPSLVGNKTAAKETKSAFIRELEDTCNAIVEQDCRVHLSLQTSSTDGNPLRHMWVEGYDRKIPCGGTHISHLREIGKMSIRKIETKSGVTRVAYSVS